MKNELYFENIGSKFDEWINPYDVIQRIKLLKTLLPPSVCSLSCLEIGCGTGRVSEAISKCFAHYTVSDISEKLSKFTGDRLGVKSMVLDVSNLSDVNESFDVVISSECIEHTKDPFNSISQMARLVKPGGFLVLTTPNRLWFPVLWISMKLGLRRFNGVENWIYPHQARSWLEGKGFGEFVVSGCHLLPWQIPTAPRWLPFFDRTGRLLFPLMINFGIRARKLSDS